MRDQAPDIAWMQYGKHLRGQQQTALAGCRKDTPEPVPSPPRADVWSCRGHKGLALARQHCCAIPRMLCILPLLPVRLTACERRRPPLRRGRPGGFLERLAPFEAPAPDWEAELLPARLSDCDPTGSTAFARPARGYGDGACRPRRARTRQQRCAWAPVTLVRRHDLAGLGSDHDIHRAVPPLSPAAQASSAPSHPVSAREPTPPLAPRSPETPEDPETRLLGPMKAQKVPDSRPRTRMFDSSRTQ